ncbi:hypothetical protein [Salipaludibacillus daqingensis]|uniref:hypothetical protein n=1 Tax=Salipaludibacillus daqingensis TaxID=3041001 RepID=UPI0024764F3F|nr:hypothetical protein [Salipaludibacillus daqingensis]
MKIKQIMLYVSISLCVFNVTSVSFFETLEGRVHAVTFDLTSTENEGRSIITETEADDEFQIEDVLYDMPDVTPIFVSIIDGQAWVYISFERMLTREEEQEKKAFIEQELTRTNPQYDYKVKIYGETE